MNVMLAVKVSHDHFISSSLICQPTHAKKNAGIMVAMGPIEAQWASDINKKVMFENFYSTAAKFWPPIL